MLPYTAISLGFIAFAMQGSSSYKCRWRCSLHIAPGPHAKCHIALGPHAKCPIAPVHTQSVTSPPVHTQRAAICSHLVVPLPLLEVELDPLPDPVLHFPGHPARRCVRKSCGNEKEERARQSARRHLGREAAPLWDTALLRRQQRRKAVHCGYPGRCMRALWPILATANPWPLRKGVQIRGP